MSVPRRTTPARRLASRLTSVGLALVVGLAATACTEQTDPPAQPDEQQTSTPLPSYDADGPAVAPRGPCNGIGADVLADALGGELETSLTWAPGQRLPGTSEVADEYGCRHTAGDVTAAAWVFAAPTTRRQARRLVKEATSQKCRRVRAAETFGDPGVAFTCSLNTGTSLTGMRGLVGPWWVSCQISGTDDSARVGRWCAAVLGSLSAS